MERAETIGRNIAAVRARIAAAADRAGRDPATVTLVAVTKTQPPEAVAAVAAGVADVGENRVQEAAEKIPLVEVADLRWHLIGHLQRNKARKAAAIFDLIHSLDSVRLAETLDRHVAQDTPPHPDGTPRRLPVLLQVNIAGEAQKEGFELSGGLGNREALPGFWEDVEHILGLQHLDVRGLMTIAPYVADPEQVRPVFRALRELRDELAVRFPAASWQELSMGMTGDFEVAVEEGATLVRVGTAIFGERH
ncbi:MAG: YggS family pyridoxal phosphate-dependent enzyme [Chloroflexota bacterium]|nr:YggS family pyridoxal phosphate-dependent enzyme [Chloroflexota bacterium]